jgi:hypothetical protein
MRFELNAFVTKKLISARDEHFDVCGAEEPGVIDVVSEALTNTICVDVEG